MKKFKKLLTLMLSAMLLISVCVIPNTAVSAEAAGGQLVATYTQGPLWTPNAGLSNADWENGVVVTREYNPTQTYYSALATAGLYASIAAGNYRMDVEVFLTGNNYVNAVTSGTQLFAIQLNNATDVIYANKGDLAPDTDGDGWQTFSFYFSLASNVSGVEIYTTELKDVGLKFRNYYLYTATAEECAAYQQVRPVWSGYAKNGLTGISGVSAVNNEMVYTANQNTSPNYWSTATAWHGISLSSGTYRFEADIALAEALSTAGIFNFQITNVNPAEGYYEGDQRRHFVERNEIEDGEPYVYYFTVASDVSSEIYFFFTGADGNAYSVDLKIGDMRIYAVDSIPEAEAKETPVWNGWAKNLSTHEGQGLSVNGNKLVYTATDNTAPNYWGGTYGPWYSLAAGTYRLEADMTIAEAAAFEELFNFNVNGATAAAGYSDYEGRDIVRRGDIEDGKPYVFYFTLADAAGVEFCFHFVNAAGKIGGVDLSIGEIRVYAVDSVPDASFEAPAWCGYAGTNLNSDSSDSITRSDKETEYNPLTAVDSKNVVYGPYATLTNGYYRIDVEVALTGNNAVEDITNQNIFAIDVTGAHGSKSLHYATGCAVSEVSANGKYAVVSRYFKVGDESVDAVELHIATWNGGNVGFKIRGVAFYKIDEFVFGDLDGDGKGNASDVVQLRKLLLEVVPSVSCESDLNGDGETNIIDLIVIKKYLVNGYWEPPVAELFYSNFKTADTLYYVDGDNLSNAELDMVMSLQGIVAKEESQIYIKRSSDTEEFEQLKTDYKINMVEETNVWSLVDRFKDSLADNGYVKYVTYYSANDYTDTPNAPDSVNTAAVISGQEKYLMIDETLVSLAQEHGLVQKANALDYTAEEIFNRYKDTLNKKVYASIDKTNHRLYDVAIALGCMVHRGELMDDFLAQMKPDGLVIGWYGNELSGVETASKYGYSTLAMDHFINGTVTAGLKRASVKQKQTAAYADSGNTDVHYVTFIMSDGDNLNYDKAMATSGNYFDVDDRGTIPFGWSLNPGVYEWLPNISSKLYNDMTANDYFVASVSGYGYMFPNLYPSDYLDDYVSRTEKYMKMTDMNYITLASNNADASELAGYVSKFAESDQILGGHFNDMSSKSEAYVHSEYGGGVVWYNDKPFIYDRESLATGWDITADRALTTEEAVSQMANRINNYARNINSIEGYTIINVNPWSMDYAACISLVEQFNDDVAVVTPKEFFELVTENVPHTNYLDMAEKNMTYGLQNVYAPADTGNYNAEHMTVENDNGTNVLVYNPTVAIDSDSTNTATVYGPYADLDAGYYRADFEIALTSNDNSDYITDNSVLFSVEINGDTSYVTKADLAEDTDGDGYVVYSKYFKLDSDATGVEYRIYADGGMRGFKLRKIYTYDANQSEYEAFVSADTLVAKFIAAEALTIGDGFTVTKDSTNGTMSYGGHTYLTDGGNVLHGPYMTLAAGNYRIELDVATTYSDGLLFNLTAISGSNTLISNKLKVYPNVLVSSGGNNYKTVSLEFSSTEEITNFHLRFSVERASSSRSFSVREMRIYSVD